MPGSICGWDKAVSKANPGCHRTGVLLEGDTDEINTCRSKRDRQSTGATYLPVSARWGEAGISDQATASLLLLQPHRITLENILHILMASNLLLLSLPPVSPRGPQGARPGAPRPCSCGHEQMFRLSSHGKPLCQVGWAQASFQL